MEWKDAKLVRAQIRSEKGGKLTVRCGGKSLDFATEPGQVVSVEP